jgi:hypothetical protein
MPPILKQDFVLNGNTWWITNIDIKTYNQDIYVIILEENKVIGNHKFFVDKEYVKQQKNRRKILYK